MSALARLAKVRQDMAMAQARRIAAEFAKARDLNEQIVQFADDYGSAAMQQGQQGISVAALRDTMAFRARLLAGAQDQDLVNAQLYRQLQEANKKAFAAKMKSEGLQKALARRKAETRHHAEAAEWREIEDGLSHRRPVFSPPQQGASQGSGTKDA
jgi:flagellar biosynthesis chaperone FliJ